MLELDASTEEELSEALDASTEEDEPTEELEGSTEEDELIEELDNSTEEDELLKAPCCSDDELLESVPEELGKEELDEREDDVGGALLDIAASVLELELLELLELLKALELTVLLLTGALELVLEPPPDDPPPHAANTSASEQTAKCDKQRFILNPPKILGL